MAGAKYESHSQRWITSHYPAWVLLEGPLFSAEDNIEMTGVASESDAPNGLMEVDLMSTPFCTQPTASTSHPPVRYLLG